MAYLASSAAVVYASINGISADQTASYDSLATGSNRLLMVAFCYENGADPNVSAITYGGVSLTKETEVTVSPSDDFSETVEVWYLANPATGSNTLALTNDAYSRDFLLMAAVYTGRDQTTPILSANNVTIARPLSDDGTATVTKPSADDDIFWALVQDRGGDTNFTAVANNDRRAQQNLDASSTGLCGAIGDMTSGSGSVTAGANQTDSGGGNHTQDLAGVFVVMQPASTAVSGSGTLQADTATTDGAGVMEREATGALQAGQATANGDGEVGGSTGSGTLQAGQATASGEGTIIKIAVSDGLQAGTATMDGTGVLARTASGTLQANTATASGEGALADAVSGTGALQADAATVSGAGVSGKVTAGALQAETAIMVGVGVRTITGTATLAATTATMYGYTWTEQAAAPGIWVEQPGPTN